MGSTSTKPFIKFKVFWDNYPSESNPCVGDDGNPPEGWSNQCAIRVGIALEKSGVSFDSFSGARCPAGPPRGGMVARAEELGKWLNQKPFANCPDHEMFGGKDWQSRVSGRTGIILFHNYWRRKGERTGNGSGDHIDLWNGSRLTWSITTAMRFLLRIPSMPSLNPFGPRDEQSNWYSDLGNSSHIWFWAIA